jgi:fructosamine-3-kinase
VNSARRGSVYPERVTSLADRLCAVLGQRPVSMAPLSGGCIGDVRRADLPDGSRFVVKSVGAGGTLDIEGWMLRYLAERSRLPVPRVIHAEPSLLVMEYVEGQSRFSDATERHAAQLLADVHSISAPAFGLERDTLIGPLHQPNPRTASWIEFFRDQRLLNMARQAADAGQIDPRLHDRIRRLADRLSSLLEEPDQPSLLHGDVWTTNVLAHADRIAAFLDPAVYYGHGEIELAFITLFATFGPAFFRRYAELRPIRPGFFEGRRDLYNLYPLLVHARLFGGGYAAQVSSILRAAGC